MDDLVDRCIKKVNARLHRENPLTKREEEIIDLANKFSRRELDEQLSIACDEDRTDDVNLILDAIAAQHDFDVLLHSLDEEAIARLKAFAEKLVAARKSSKNT